jgi:D-glycero-D-manno-heptose 1,7-bisphosphate phosphatase
VDKAVFLDRDNTLIANDGDLGDPDRVRLLHGVGPALEALHRAGYRLVVVSNQGGVARGVFGEADVDAVNERIARLVEDATGVAGVIERFYYCPHHPEGTVEAYRREHAWRKPQPGMLLQAAIDLDLDLERCWMIGDQPRDVLAGQAAGCRTVLLGQPDGATAAEPTARAVTIADAVRIVLGCDDDSPHPRTPSPGPASIEPDSHGRGGPRDDEELADRLHRAIVDLTDELRSERLRRAEFTMLRMTAVLCQLLVLLLALLGLLQLQSFETFARWMVGAILMQLVTVSLLMLDLNR